ncbi:MAG: hypothetical protein HDT32_03830 [Clostridiales bacterium]|nr:hypothetical protein [Clostridiales bacterium]
MKKKVSILIIFILIFVVIFAGCSKEYSEVDARAMVETLDDSIHNEWSNFRPLSVQNEIVVLSNSEEIVRYNKSYVLLEDNIGKLEINTIYFNDFNCDMNNFQEVYFKNDTIYMKYTDSNGESIRNYDSDITSFMTLISDGTNNIFNYNYNYDYFNDMAYEELEDAVKIIFEVNNANIEDFLGEKDLPIENMSFSYTMYNDVNKMVVEFVYDTIQSGQSAHVIAKCTAEEIGEIVFPYWVD